MPPTPKTKYASEEIWRQSLAQQFETVRLLMHPNFPDQGRNLATTRHRLERIRASGLPEWRERYDAEFGAWPPDAN